MAETLFSDSAAPRVASTEPSPARERDEGEASSYCPRCSARLEGRSCKLICLGCGYYMSCSDFY